MNEHAEQQFLAKIDAALQTIRRVLDNTRNPEKPAEVPHKYDDKYLLAEFVTHVTMASALQCFEGLGLTEEHLLRLAEWAKTRTVTLRLSAQESCRFLREETRTVESPQHVTEVQGVFGKSTRTEKVLLKVTEYFWRFDFSYEIVAYQGNAPENAVALLTRSGGIDLKTPANQTPRPTTAVRLPIDVDVSWFFAHLDDRARPRFAIDRAAAKCHTPRRNPEIERALPALAALHTWCGRVFNYFQNELFPAHVDHGRDLSAISAAGLFVPVVPLFENGQRNPGEGLLPPSHATAFLEEERRSLTERFQALAAAFPNDGRIITAVEASLLVTLLHLREVIEHHSHSVDYVERMLRNQLVAAIGKVVTPADFTAYMDFHHRKLVKEIYRPRPFSYAVRRPEHDPEGVVSIEVDRGKSLADPVSTTVAWTQATRPMKFALDASTRVSFMGDRFLHSWIIHQFSGNAPISSQLVARARQFSSFILLVGRIASADTFEPRFGVLVENKDLLKIPLMLEEIPTPKQFRDAIESLSPEQQRFAKAFRGMQLESTLFGVCVIQVKPQLEKVLKLPPDSLTKEIKLTQQLLELFTEYQIPSDLLSYDGEEGAPIADKLARVKEYTARIFEMINLSKRGEIDDERAREAFRRAEMNMTHHPADDDFYEARTPVPRSPAAGSARAMEGEPTTMRAPPPAMAERASIGSLPALGSMASPPAVRPPARGKSPGPPPPVARVVPPPRAAAGAPAVHATRTAPPPAPKAAETAPRPVPERRRAEPSSEQGSEREGDDRDYTKVPSELDRRFEQLDDDGALHATLIHPGDTWTRTARKGLLSDPVTAKLEDDEQETEKHKTFDLLDALTKSGALPIEDASLHVVIAATHRFDKTLIDTVIQDNVNPIEKVERSLMIAGTTIFSLPARELLANDQRERFFLTSPKLESPEES